MINSFLILCCLIQVSLFFGTTANAETHCICQVGQQPAVQRPLFRMGCNMWLNEQVDCDSKRITDFTGSTFSPQDFDLPPSAQNGTLKLGYVGHWSNTSMSLNYIFNSIVPLMKKLNVDVLVDNTACKGADEPERIGEVAQAFGILFPDNKTLTYKANQVISIGLWDRVTPLKSFNFEASIELPSGKINYPSCDRFFNKACSAAFQAYQGATCVQNKADMMQVKCCPDSASSTYEKKPKASWKWLPDLSTKCLKP